MKLIERYVYAVTKHMPDDQRQEVAKELRANIEDMLEDKGSRSEKHIKQVLIELGDPDVLAATYRGSKQYVVGPEYYPVYVRTLRLVAAIGLPLAFALNAIARVVQDGFSVGALIGTSVATLITVTAHIVFWTTLVFVIIERTKTSRQQAFGEWTPDSLPELLAKQHIPTSEVITDFVGYGFIALLPYISGQFLGYKENGAFVETLNPALWDWAPFITAIGVLGLIKAGLKLYTKNWTMRLASFNVLVNAAAIAGLLLLYANTDIINPDMVRVIQQHATDSSIEIPQIIDWVFLIGIMSTVCTYIFDSVMSVLKSRNA